ncbi:MAG TPA: recombinase RecA [Candidatus Pacearchaeota archaeon]|nr:recombinase RecA [Candidatus Pacearchaeota archaeon]
MGDLKGLMNEASKKFGEGSLIQGSNCTVSPIICSTGSILLDYALGCGGIPEGKIIGITGMPSGGKSLLCLHMVREAQEAGYNCGYIDAENSYDPIWSEKMGVDNEKLLISQPNSGDEAFALADMMAKSGDIKLIIVDSVAALTPKAVLEGEYDQNHIGQLARLMSQSLNKINSILVKNKTTLVLINQQRMKIGGYGNPITEPGGEAIKFYASVKLEVNRSEVIGDKEDVDGFLTRIKVVKNKCGVPFRKVETNIYLGKNGKYGIDKNEEIFTLAIDNAIVKKAGSWFSYGDERLGQGKDNALKTVIDNPKWLEEITNAVYDSVLKITKPKENSFNAKIKEAISTDTKTTKRRSKKEEGIIGVEEISTPVEVKTEEVIEAETVEEN